MLSCVDEDGDTQKMHNAQAELCKIYWRPVFAFIRRLGHSPPDAQDLTQDFFVMVLKGQLLQRANPARGRFRSLVGVPPWVVPNRVSPWAMAVMVAAAAPSG